MKRKLFVFIVCIQICIVIALLVQLQNKKNTLGISISTIDSKTIQKTPISGLSYFYEPKPNSTEEVYKDWLTNTPRYTINKDTLNERFDYTIKKKKNVFRIITLGDSFTFGEYVDTKNNYPELLEDKLNAQCSNTTFEVINLGVRGYDIQYMVERYRLRGVKYNPELVIVLLGNFQLFRMKEDLIVRANDMQKKYPKMDLETVYDKTNKDLISEYGWSALIKWQKVHIGELMSIVKSKIVLAKFPFSCVNNKYISNWLEFECWPFSEYDKLLEKEAKQKKSYFFNNLTRNSNLSFQDGHPNSEGYKIISDEILGYLIKNKIVPCDITQENK